MDEEQSSSEEIKKQAEAAERLAAKLAELDQKKKNLQITNEEYVRKVREITKATEDHSKATEVATYVSRNFSETITLAGEKLSQVKDILGGYIKSLDVGNKSIESVSGMLSDHATAFSLVSTAILGSSKAFTEYEQYVNSATGIKTYTEQYKGMIDTISDNRLLKAIGAMGISDDQVRKAQESGKTIKQIFTDLLASADEKVRLREMVTSSLSETGMLDFKRSQTDMEGYYNSQISLIGSVAGATNELPKTVATYYAQLKLIPGAYEAVAKSGEGGETIPFLQSLIQFSKGAKVSMSELSTASQNAYRNLSVKPGDEMIDYLAAIKKASSDTHQSFREVETVVENLSGKLSLFGNNTSGIAASMGEMVAALEKTGLSAQASTRLFQNFADQVTNFNIAQRSFLSQQSGGPGGLLGGLQIEQMLAEGKSSDVINMTIESLKKQIGGPIITREEAVKSGSEEMAAQYERQRALLQQSPFGKLATSPEAAERILSALKLKDEGQVEAGTGLSAEEYLKAGLAEQQRVSTQARDIQVAADITKLSTVPEIERGLRLVTSRTEEQQTFQETAEKEFGRTGRDIAKKISQGEKMSEKIDLSQIQETTSHFIRSLGKLTGALMEGAEKISKETSKIRTADVNKSIEMDYRARGAQTGRGPAPSPEAARVSPEPVIRAAADVQASPTAARATTTTTVTPGAGAEPAGRVQIDLNVHYPNGHQESLGTVDTPVRITR